MIFEILGTLLVALFVSSVGHVLIVGVKNHQKQKFFAEKSPDLKVLDKPELFGGHTNQIVHRKYNWRAVERLLDEHGPTLGFYLGSRPAVITKDLDFIKKFIIDEQIHTNRMTLDLPIREIEEDSIMFAENEQWLRMRKSLAPAFS